jgi:putative aldouronate transport system substrate-binding protein
LKKYVVGIVMLLLVTALSGTVGLAAKQVPKPKVIHAFLDTVLDVQTGQVQFCTEYKKQTGIELQITKPVHNQYYEKLRLAFASGDIPDVVEIADSNYVQYANERAFVDLSKYVNKSTTLRKIAKSLLPYRLKGKLYGIPVGTTNGPVTYIRKDWLQKLGLKAPTTWAEYYRVMKAFTLNDPDGNGKNDTYGMTQGASTNGSICLADNNYRDFYLNASPSLIFRNGKWIDGMMQKEFKPALERLRRAYQEKLIDPEIFTNKSSTCREKFQSGKAGIFPYWAGLWQARLEDELQKNLGPQAQIIPIAPLKGSYNIGRTMPLNAITVKAKNPEGIFKYFLEYANDGAKGQMLFVHGVAGVHWKKEGKKTVALPSLNNPRILVQKAFRTPSEILVPWAGGKDPIPYDERVSESLKIFKSNYKADRLPVFPASRQKIEDSLNIAKNDVLTKTMTGTKTIQQALADYKKKYAELKMDQVLREMNAQSK